MSNPPPLWTQCLVVGAGGFAGAVTRFLLSREVAHRLPDRFASAGTLAVNVLGCLLIGAVLVWIESREPPVWIKAVVVTGFLGSLTTFSTFGYETVELVRESRLHDAVVNVLANVTLGLLAVVSGAWVTGRIV